MGVDVRLTVLKRTCLLWYSTLSFANLVTRALIIWLFEPQMMANYFANQCETFAVFG